jgi:hypothetical protein
VQDSLTHDPVINPDNDSKDASVDKPLQMDLQVIKIEQLNDQYLKHLIAFLCTKKEPLDRNIYTKILGDQADFVMRDDILYFIYKPRKHKNFDHEWQLHVVIPEKLVPIALRLCHTDRCINLHNGVAATLSSLYSSKLFWKNMNKDTVTYVDSCHQCRSDKNPKGVTLPPVQKHRPGMPIPFDTIHLDTYGPLCTSKNTNKKYLIGATCKFSGHLTLAAVEHNNAQEVAQVLVDRIVTIFGTPRVVNTDHGSNYMAKVTNALCKLLNIVHTTSATYHPASNSHIECKWRGVRSASAKMLQNHAEWDTLIPFIQMSANNQKRQSLGGLSPNEIVFGHQIATPLPMPCLSQTSLTQLPMTMLPNLNPKLNPCILLFPRSSLITTKNLPNI